jgi:transposase
MGLMRKSRLSIYKQDRLLEHFVAGTTARTAASLCGVNRKTAAFYFHRLREVIAFELDHEGLSMFAGEIEVDESVRRRMIWNSRANFGSEVIGSSGLSYAA